MIQAYRQFSKVVTLKSAHAPVPDLGHAAPEQQV